MRANNNTHYRHAYMRKFAETPCSISPQYKSPGYTSTTIAHARRSWHMHCREFDATSNLHVFMGMVQGTQGIPDKGKLAGCLLHTYRETLITNH